MRFNSETERLAHPQARLIPKSVWDREFFWLQFPDWFIPIMQEQNLDQLSNLIQQLDRSNLLKHNLNMWLAIAFSHPNLSLDFLKTIAQTLEIDNDAFLMYIVILGNCFFLAELAQDSIYYNSLSVHIDYVFITACSHGNLGIVKYLVSEFYDKLKSTIPNCFIGAANNGYLNLLHYFKEILSGKEILEVMKREVYIVKRFSNQLYIENWFSSPHLIFSLLSINEIFLNAKYFCWQDFLPPYINNVLTQLIEQKKQFESTHPNEKFDVNPKMAQHLFIIIRYLITSNDENKNTDILFLLNIPAVAKEIEMQEKEANQTLLHIAAQEESLEGCKLLLSLKKNTLGGVGTYGIFTKSFTMIDSSIEMDPAFRSNI